VAQRTGDAPVDSDGYTGVAVTAFGSASSWSGREAAEALVALATAARSCVACPQDLARSLWEISDDLALPRTLEMRCIERAIETSYASALQCAATQHAECGVKEHAAVAMRLLRDLVGTGS